MYRGFVLLVALSMLAVHWCGGAAQASNLGYSRGMSRGLEHISFNTPVLGPFAHVRFCFEYPEDCRVRRMVFRGGKIALTEQRRKELVAINAEVNRSIRFERNLEGVAGEKWLISPPTGDCNDYAVTKRHELMARGWPARDLLLAEVVTTWGEHHLVVVVRTKEADLVIDNLNANIRPWNKTQYRWVRIQMPTNPLYWSTIGRAAA